MNCLRCGRETQEDHVFCESCREEMGKYPVRPETAVILPRRREEASPKKAKRHGKAPLSPEEQVRKLKKQRFWISFLSLLLTVVLITSLVLTYLDLKKTELRPGQNYSAVETTAPAANP